MGDATQDDLITLPMRISNYFRRNVTTQNDKGYIQKKLSALEILTFNYLPVLMTSTLLAPLNRIKVILQVQNLLPETPNKKGLSTLPLIKKLLSEQGVKSMWKGNLAYSLKIFNQISCKTILFDRLKHKANKTCDYLDSFRYKIFGIRIVLNLMAAVASSLVTLMVSFPLDMAAARLSGQYTFNQDKKFNYNKVMECFDSTKDKKGMLKYYPGLTAALAESIIYSTIILIGFQTISLMKLMNDDKKSNTFVATSVVAFIAGVLSYPFDTIKRQLQVDGATGYKTMQQTDIFKLMTNTNVEHLYRGFPIHLMRSIPFTFIHYQIFLCLTSLVKKDKK